MSTSTITLPNGSRRIVNTTTPAEFYNQWLRPLSPSERAFRRSLIVAVIDTHTGSADNDWRRALVAHIDSQEA